MRGRLRESAEAWECRGARAIQSAHSNGGNRDCTDRCRRRKDSWDERSASAGARGGHKTASKEASILKDGTYRRFRKFIFPPEVAWLLSYSVCHHEKAGRCHCSEKMVLNVGLV